MRKSNTKDNKGITLIALIVTIIVMLLMAAVTINSAVNGGLFVYAQKSVAEYDVSKEKELLEQAKMMAMIANKNAVIKKTELDNALNQVVGEGNYSSETTEEGINVTFNGSGRNYFLEYNEQVQQEYFYVYKTSDCSVERFLITAEMNDGYDITSKVDEDHYYAGYFSTYGGTESDIPNLNYEDNKATDEDGEIYDCSSTKSSKNVKFWDRNTAYTELGTEIKPKDGSIYYLCEIPKIYLKVKTILTYNTRNHNSLEEIFGISIINNNNYLERKISVICNDEVNNISATLTPKFTIVSGSVSSTSISYSDFEGITSGYLMLGHGFFETINPNTQFTILPYVVTYDGIRIDGTPRTYNTGIDENGYCTPQTIYEVTN